MARRLQLLANRSGPHLGIAGQGVDKNEGLAARRGRGIFIIKRFAGGDFQYGHVYSFASSAAGITGATRKRAKIEQAMGITAKSLQELGLVDEIIEEPLGAAHRDYDNTAKTLKNSLVMAVNELKSLDTVDLVSARQSRIRQYGCFNN